MIVDSLDEGAEKNIDFRPKEEDEERLKRLKTRDRIVKEVINTEKDYVEDMKLMVEVFKVPLEESGIISKNEIWTLFGNIMDLIVINEQMLRKFVLRKVETLRSGLELGDMPLGDIFCEMTEPLMKYEMYCANQSDAFAFLEDAKEGNMEFNQFLEDCMNNPKCRGLGLQAWLIKPLQRLCKYPLLLRELVKHTQENSPDYSQLLAADEKIAVTVSFVNNAKQKADQAAEEEKRFLAHMEQMFKQDNLDLVKVGRKLDKTGNFIETFGKKKNKKRPVTLFLFTDMIMLTGLEKGKQHLYWHILLRNVRITDIGNTQSYENAFEIRDTENEVVSILTCDTSEEKREWLRLVKIKIKEYQQQRFNRSKKTVSSASLQYSGNTGGGTIRGLSSLSQSDNSVQRTPIQDKQISQSTLSSLSPEEVKKKLFRFDIPSFGVPSNEVEKITSLASKTRLIRELVNTERDFVTDIQTMIEVFVEPLDYSGIISRHDVWKLFSDIQELIEINQNHLLQKIETRTKEVRSVQTMRLGDILFSLAENLIAYEKYCSNLGTALNLLSLISLPLPENKQFLDFMQLCASDPKCRGLPLSEFLKKPLQHLHRYPYFISELIKVTPEDNHDHSLLKDAYKCMNLTLEQIINKCKEEDEALFQQMELLTIIAGFLAWPDKIKVTVNKPGRKFILQSTTQLQESDNNQINYTTKEIILLSDLLIIATPNQDGYAVNKIIWMDNVIEVKSLDPNTICIKSRKSADDTLVSFVVSKEKEDWEVALNKVLQVLQNQRFKRGKRIAEGWKGKRASYSWNITQKINSPAPKKLVQSLPEIPEASFKRVGSSGPSTSWAQGRIKKSNEQTSPRNKEGSSPRHITLSPRRITSIATARLEIKDVGEPKILDENHAQCEKLVLEIIEFEKQHILDLKTIEEVLYDPLEESGIISVNDLWTLFGNIKKITEVHVATLDKWEEQIRKKTQEGAKLAVMNIVPLLQKFVKDLRCYRLYNSNHVYCNSIFEKLCSSSDDEVNTGLETDFAIWVKEVEANPKLKGESIMVWLDKPTKILATYLPILEKFSSIFPRGHPFHKGIYSARSGLSKLINTSKEKEKEEENSKVFLKTLEQAFGDSLDLVSNNRKLIKQNSAIMVTDTEETKEIIVVLFSDILLIIEKIKPNMKLLKKFYFKEVETININDGGNVINAIDIHCGGESLTISFASTELKSKWFKLLNSSPEDLELKKSKHHQKSPQSSRIKTKSAKRNHKQSKSDTRVSATNSSPNIPILSSNIKAPKNLVGSAPDSLEAITRLTKSHDSMNPHKAKN